MEDPRSERQIPETSIKTQVSRSERQEASIKTQDQNLEARSKRQETRDKRQEAKRQSIKKERIEDREIV